VDAGKASFGRRMPPVELRQLRYFVAVAEEENFSRAAERLRIAQSGLSQQIRVLERSLGVRLFDRDARPIRLTAQGAALLEHARVILELAERATEEIRRPGGLRKTILRFGGSSFGNGPVVDQVLTAARARLSHVDLEVHLDTTAHNIWALNRRSLDVVFAYVPFESPKTPKYLRLGTIELLLALPEHHPLAASERIRREELLREPFLIGPRSINPPLFDRIHLSLIGRTSHPKAVEISDVGTARFRLVAEGLGLTPVAVPMESLLPIPGVVYRRVEQPLPTIEYGLLWFEDHVSPGVLSFLEIAREVSGAQPPLDLEMVPSSTQATSA
jgi:DNA-binding transcriptional LysR family regulator